MNRSYHFHIPWKKLAQAMILLLLLLPFFLNLATNFVPWSLHGKAEEGKPYRFAVDEEYWAPIENYVVTENHIYILFDGPGVLKCYGINGTYLHAFHFQQGSNGSACLRYAKDKSMLLFDREHNAYRIVDGEIAGYYPAEEVDRLMEEKGVSFAYSETRGYGENISSYHLKFGSLWKETNDGEVCVIRRPVWAWFANPIFLFCWGVLQPVALVILNDILEKKKRSV